MLTYKRILCPYLPHPKWVMVWHNNRVVLSVADLGYSLDELSDMAWEAISLKGNPIH